ncbi:transglycosylase SLT domain-containing protein [Methylobacterium sp. J-090]|uniref:transglycosylase SLT domain-containing protein n=1 Tax=Methylobacterium sp. J-090 TaxID=2836666 RepID=UPI00391D5B2F
MRLPPAALSEADCLDALMTLRMGDAPCRACDARAGHRREARNRAFSCRACGLKTFPCQGTPFARPQPPLPVWFWAIHQAARAPVSARFLRRGLGLSRQVAGPLAEAVARMTAPEAAPTERALAAGIAAFVAERLNEAAGAPETRGAPLNRGTSAHPSERETLWQTLRSVIALPQIEGRPLGVAAALGGFMLVGAGVGWLMAPAPPEPDAELAQATVILSLGEDKPVILVSAEVAAQLYDVTDVDADPSASLASAIRITPAGPGPAQRAAAPPAAIPAVRLSVGLGKSLLDGNAAAARAGGRDRPELAAYTSLARELEAKGPRNPDELLVFGPMQIRRHLVEKIMRAARVVSMDPVLLMAIADKESSFKTEVQAATSSASGLFQFIEKTWLGVVREFGPQHGMDAQARLMRERDLTPAERTEVLDLRRDAYLSAVMAAEMLKRDSGRIAQRIGRNLTGGEVYLVHFLGPDGAERFIAQMARKPETVAAELLPRPAAANKSIFYGAGGEGASKSLSVAQVHGKFETMISLRLDRYRTVKGMGDGKGTGDGKGMGEGPRGR